MHVSQFSETPGRVVKVVGPVQSGKTSYAIDQVVRLIKVGVRPQRICVVVLTFDAADVFRNRVAAALDAAPTQDAVANLVVVTPLELCVRVLSDADAQAFTNRVPRILNDVEFGMLLEDLKPLFDDASSLRRALGEVLASKATTTQVAGLSADARRLASRMDDLLVQRGCMLKEEAAPLARAYLQSDAGADARCAYDTVIVDGYQNLSAASQQVCTLLAEEALIAIGSPDQAQAGFDAKPNPRGFVELERERPDVDTVQLPQGTDPKAVTRFCRAVLDEGAARYEEDAATDDEVRRQHAEDRLHPERNCDAESVRGVKWREPRDEFDGIARLVHRTLREREDLEPGSVYIMAPTRAWAQAMAHALDENGVKATMAFDGNPLVGNPRSIEHAGSVMAYAKLALAARPQDVTAWRTWCGLGSQTFRRQAWDNLERYAADQGCAPLDALKALAGENAEPAPTVGAAPEGSTSAAGAAPAGEDASPVKTGTSAVASDKSHVEAVPSSDTPDEPFEGADILRACYEQGRAVVTGAHERRGESLVGFVAPGVEGRAFRDMIGLVDDDATASDIFALAFRRALEPSFGDQVGRVLVGSARCMEGWAPRIVIACGMVDSLTPPNSCLIPRGAKAASLDDASRCRIMARQRAYRRMFCSAAGKARETLVLSLFQRVDAQTAERFGITTRYARSVHRRTVSAVTPSVLIESAGDAAPSMVSGEQFLGDMGRMQR